MKIQTVPIPYLGTLGLTFLRFISRDLLSCACRIDQNEDAEVDCHDAPAVGDDGSLPAYIAQQHPEYPQHTSNSPPGASAPQSTGVPSARPKVQHSRQ